MLIWLCTTAVVLGAPASSSSAAVLTLGHDVESVARLQYGLERALNAEKVEVEPSVAVAERLGDPEGERRPPSREFQRAQQETTAAFQEAINAFYEENFPHALDQFSLIAKSHADFAGFSNAERVRVRLWRATVYLASEDNDHADEEIRLALSLNPAMEPDPNEFRPSLRDRVAQVRHAGIPELPIELVGLPSDVHVIVDGRPVEGGARFSVPPGAHWFLIQASRHRELAFRREIGRPTTLRLTLPIALPDKTEETLARVLWAETISPIERQTLNRLSEQAGVGWIAVAGQRREPAKQIRVTLVRVGDEAEVWGSSTMDFGAEALPELAKWVKRQIRTRRPEGMGPPPTSATRVDVSVDAGGIYTYRSRSVKGSDTQYDTAFTGGGSAIHVTMQYGSVVAIVGGQFVSYEGSTLALHLNSGDYDLSGGSAWSMEGTAGGRLAAGSGALLLLAGIAHSSYLGPPEAAAQAVLPGYSYTHARLRLEASAGTRWFASAGGYVDPFGLFAEKPGEASGNNPKPGIGYGWRARAGWRSALWSVYAQHDGGLQAIQYSGTATIPTNTPITDVRTTEMVLSALLVVRRNF